MICFLCILALVGCNKDKAKLIDKSTGKEVQMKVLRFEDVLFKQGQKDYRAYLMSNYNDYSPLFNTTLDNSAYYNQICQFVSDKEMQKTYQIVKKRYPSLDWVGQGVTSAFGFLQKDYPDIKIPKLYSLIIGPMDYNYAYEGKIVAQKGFIAFAIDIYSVSSLQKNRYYAQYPKYIQAMCDSAFIVSDIMSAYLKTVMFSNQADIEYNPSSTFCDIMIERGKFLYMLERIMPSCPLSNIFRYSPDQMDWVQKNEKKIWNFILSNDLLYNKNRMDYMILTGEGPSTKGIDGSPARLADYIGYCIVKKYMKENNVTPTQLFQMQDSKIILNKSKYKPSK
jgi:hypothetical protein